MRFHNVGAILSAQDFCMLRAVVDNRLWVMLHAKILEADV